MEAAQDISTYELVVGILADMVISVLDNRRFLCPPEPRVWKLVSELIDREEYELQDRELTARLLGTHDFTRVA